ncbi:MAG: OmpA family protein [Bacteroidota bacterium]
MKDKWEFYKDIGDQWRWRRTAPDGSIVGTSTGSYVNKSECEENARHNSWNGDAAVQGRNENVIHDLVEERARAKRDAQMKTILFTIVGILCVIVAILLFMLFKTTPEVKLAQQAPPELKVMMMVLDPKADEKVVVFGDTYFDYDKSTLSKEAKTSLDKDVQGLKDNPKINVRMAGYTSAEGTEKDNQKLSERRANTVRDYLIERGIAPERITVIGYGRTRPAVYEVKPGNTNSKEAKANMRVLFEVVVK